MEYNIEHHSPMTHCVMTIIENKQQTVWTAIKFRWYLCDYFWNE